MKKFIISLLYILTLAEFNVSWAEIPAAPTIRLEVGTDTFSIFLESENSVDGYELSVAPLPSVSPVTTQDVGLNSIVGLDISILEEVEGYYVAAKAYNDEGYSELSKIRVLSVNKTPQMLDQLSRFLHQFNGFQFNNWISLGDQIKFQHRAYSDGFDVIVNLGIDTIAQYFVISQLGIGGEIELSSFPKDIDGIESAIWHQMVHAVNDASSQPFVRGNNDDNEIDNHIAIKWAEEIIKTSLANHLVAFEEFAFANLETPLDQPYDQTSNSNSITVEERANQLWSLFADSLKPDGVEVTQAHIDELIVLIGWEVDSEKIKARYLQLGYPQEFFPSANLKLVLNEKVFENGFTLTIPVGESFFDQLYTLINFGGASITLNKIESTNPSYTVLGPVNAVVKAQEGVTFTLRHILNPSDFSSAVTSTTISHGQSELPEEDLTFTVSTLIGYRGLYRIYTTDSSRDSGLFTCNGNSDIVLELELTGDGRYVLNFAENDIFFRYVNNGNVVSNQTITYQEDDGSTTEILDVYIDVFGNLGGTSSWSWVSNDRSESCTGTTTYSGSIQR